MVKEIISWKIREMRIYFFKDHEDKYAILCNGKITVYPDIFSAGRALTDTIHNIQNKVAEA